MAIDEKHLGDLSANESAVDRLRKRNRRIRPWESSRLENDSGEHASVNETGELPSGQNTQGVAYPLVIKPPAQDTHGAYRPVGGLPHIEPELEVKPHGIPTRGLETPTVECPEGKMPTGEITERSFNRGGDSSICMPEEVKSTTGQDILRSKYPGGSLPSAQTRKKREKIKYKQDDPRLKDPEGKLTGGAIDRDGGFDPRPFLPEQQQNHEWREKGNGELRIPHRLYEFLQRVTTTRNELLVLNCLVRFSLGFHREWCEAGYSFISSWTGISDATNVKKSVRSLLDSGVIRKKREHDCVSNTGSIYELPVVQAYLSYLKVSKSETEPPSKNGYTPQGISTPGFLAQGSKYSGPSGQIDQSPLGETPPKKENLNKNSKKTLSQNALSELDSYVTQIKPASKRESENHFLGKLLSEYSPEDVLLALKYVQRYGALGSKEECHSPMKYLCSAIEQVLHIARKSKAVFQVVGAEIPKIKTESLREDNESKVVLRSMALAAFESELSELEQERIITEVKIENSLNGYVPPQRVLRVIAALKWFKPK